MRRTSHLYPMRRAKCKQVSSRWLWNSGGSAVPPHSGQTCGGRLRCMRWWAAAQQPFDRSMGGEHSVHDWKTTEEQRKWIKVEFIFISLEDKFLAPSRSKHSQWFVLVWFLGNAPQPLLCCWTELDTQDIYYCYNAPPLLSYWILLYVAGVLGL